MRVGLAHKGREGNSSAPRFSATYFSSEETLGPEKLLNLFYEKPNLIEIVGLRGKKYHDLGALVVSINMIAINLNHS